MTISAKFATVCPCCSQRINVGDKVEWTKGSKARHVTCSARPNAVTTASAAPRRERMGSGHGSAGSVRGYSSYCTDNASCGCYDCAS